MEYLSVVGVRRLIVLLVAAFLAVAAGPSAQADDVPAVDVESELLYLHTNCDRSSWCTPSYWAWQLHLANQEEDDARGEAIAQLLLARQEPQGHWGLGAPWGKAPYDFKRRTARDAESWEVAEVGLALLDHFEDTGSRAAYTAAERAADYLAARVITLRGKRFLSHMPDCNNRIQAHSTVAGAYLLSRFPRYTALATSLRESGKWLKWRRIMPKPGRTDLKKWRWYVKVNDYERVQVGYYLAEMGDPAGERILRRYRTRDSMPFYRKQPYLVMAESRLGHAASAWDQAIDQAEFVPVRGYDWALRDWIDAVLGDQIRY